MHPAIHRALRELVADAQLLAYRWRRLAARLDGDSDAAAPLRDGAQVASELVDALAGLARARQIPLRGTASGLGMTIGATLSTVGEPFLERNQALRTAVMDAHRTTLLLHYLEHLARAATDPELAGAATDWAHRLVACEGRVRERAIALGDTPDAAIDPVDHTPVGQAAHRVAVRVGGAGEWVDRHLA